MKRILIVGRGFVGSEFARQLTELKADFRMISRPVDPIRTIKDYHPHFVINAAGYCGEKNIDDCEVNRQETFDCNVALPVKLAEICRAKFIPWLHVSSACLWPSNIVRRGRPVPWKEEDKPLIDLDDQIYAGSKRMAEDLIAGSFATICRIRMPFTDSPQPRNLITKLIGYPMAMEGINSLTYLPEAVSAMLNLLGRGEYGLFHVVNPGYLDTREIIDLIEKYVKPERRWPIVEQLELLHPIMSVMRSTCVVSSAKIAGLGIKLEPVQDAFMKAVKNYAKA